MTGGKGALDDPKRPRISRRYYVRCIIAPTRLAYHPPTHSELQTGCGVVGFVKFVDCYYLILITQR